MMKDSSDGVHIYLYWVVWNENMILLERWQPFDLRTWIGVWNYSTDDKVMVLGSDTSNGKLPV